MPLPTPPQDAPLLPHATLLTPQPPLSLLPLSRRPLSPLLPQHIVPHTPTQLSTQQERQPQHPLEQQRTLRHSPPAPGYRQTDLRSRSLSPSLLLRCTMPSMAPSRRQSPRKSPRAHPLGSFLGRSSPVSRIRWRRTQASTTDRHRILDRDRMASGAS